MLALLFFLNSALCYCMSFSHDHDHGTSTESPVPHDCDCSATVDPLPADVAVDLDAPVLVVADALDRVETLLTQERSTRILRDVRPPGEHAPPRYSLLCTLLC